MKKFLTLRNALKAGAVLLAIIAFFLSFADQLFYTGLDNKAHFISATNSVWNGNGCIASGIGYILILVFGLLTAGMIFLPTDEKIKKYIFLGFAVPFIVAAILIFCAAGIYNSNALGDGYGLSAAPVIAGIFGIFCACLVAGSEFIADKPLVK